MRTAIIGLGNMGQGLARRLAGKVDLVVAARAPGQAVAFAATLDGATPAPIDAAIAQADIVVLALPYEAARDLAARASLAGKIVVDMSNPVAPDFSGLTLGHSTSAAEQIAHGAAKACVVKAFNTIFAQVFDASRAATADVPVFVAGDDEGAVEAVADLVAKAGFAVERTGGLDAARLLEPVGMLNIRLGYSLGRGSGIAPTWTALAA